MGKVTLDLVRFDNITAKAAENGLRAALGRAETILKADILSRPGTGKVYGAHRASAPGEPPAADTGSLRSNTNADPELHEDGDDLSGRIVANSAQASWLERGTERMAARPYLSTLRDQHDAELQRAFSAGAKGGS